MKIFSTGYRTTINDTRFITFLLVPLLVLIFLAPIFLIFLLLLCLAVGFTLKAFSKKPPLTPKTHRSTQSCHVPQPPRANTSSNTHHTNRQPNLKVPPLRASNFNSMGRTSSVCVNATLTNRDLNRSLTMTARLIRYLSSILPIALPKKINTSFMITFST